MKRYFILFVVMFVSLFFAGAKSALCFDSTSESALLMDAFSKDILYEKNSEKEMAPASLTKLMTLLIVFEQLEQGKISLNDTTVISENASGMGGTQLFLEVGEERKIEELIYATLIESANDASVALAEACGGSYDNFIELMNQKATELNLKNTCFKNPSGLDEEGHYTCAYDLGVIASELVSKHEQIFTYSKTWTKDVYIGKNNDIKRTLVNTNKLISRSDIIDGLKTGFTENAGCCIVTTAKSGQMRLIGVILNAPSAQVRFSEGLDIIHYGINSFEAKSYAKKGEAVTTIPLKNGNGVEAIIESENDIYLTRHKNALSEIKTEITLKEEFLCAPVAKGDKVGVLSVSENGKVINSTPLIVSRNYEKCSVSEFAKKISSELNILN